MPLLADDKTDLSSYRTAAGAPPTSATTTTGSVPTGPKSSNAPDLQHLYHLSDAEASMTVLFGSKYILDPMGPNAPKEIIKYQTEGADNDILHGEPIRTPLPGPVDSPWNMLDAMQFFSTSTPESRAYIQAALYNQGLLPKRWNKFGQDDDASFKAWKNALLRAARGNQTVWQALTGKKVTMTQFFDGQAEGGNQVKLAASALRKSMTGAGGGGGPTRAPLQVRYSSPADLKSEARLAAQDALGYVPDEDYLDDFVKVYHGLEGKFQKSAYAGKRSVTEPGQPRNIAEQEIRGDYKTQTEGYDIVKAFSSMMQAMGVQSA